ncbi:MAG: hypothetical protein CVT60_05220 [Actinobacteria bacterium HGW-Actinobacteria-10]|nr:MAG: hypothetical protein CVT60_05220 [Actinobacteria bacterium HGW-Actinobacteria-10]
MISTVLSYLVPGAIAVSVVWYLARNPAYVLLIPMLLAVGRAAYIDTHGWTIAGLGVDQIVVLVLVGCALVLVALRPSSRLQDRHSLGLGMFGLYALWIVVTAGLSVAEGLSIGKAITSAIYSMTLPMSVGAWLLAFSRITDEELISVMRVLAVITSVLCLLYTMQAVGIRTYPYNAYMSVFVQDRLVVRDFATFPYFAVPIALAWAVASNERALLRIPIAAACLIATAATFTRSTILAGIAALLIAGMLASWKRPITQHRKLPVGTIATALTLVAAMTLSLDGYWSVRLAPGLLDANVTSRAAAILNNVRSSGLLDALTGYGFGTVMETPVGVVAGDSLWIYIVYRFGMIGVVLLAGALLAAAVDGSRAVVSTPEPKPRTLAAVAGALPIAVLLFSLAGVPSSLSTGLALSLGPALVMGVIGARQLPETSHLDVWSLLPDRFRSNAWRRVLSLLAILTMLSVEVWIGMRLVR